MMSLQFCCTIDLIRLTHAPTLANKTVWLCTAHELHKCYKNLVHYLTDNAVITASHMKILWDHRLLTHAHSHIWYTNIFLTLLVCGQTNKTVQTVKRREDHENESEIRSWSGLQQERRKPLVQYVLHASCSLATKLGHTDSPWWHNRLQPLSKQVLKNTWIFLAVTTINMS